MQILEHVNHDYGHYNRCGLKQIEEKRRNKERKKSFRCSFLSSKTIRNLTWIASKLDSHATLFLICSSDGAIISTGRSFFFSFVAQLNRQWKERNEGTKEKLDRWKKRRKKVLKLKSFLNIESSKVMKTVSNSRFPFNLHSLVCTISLANWNFYFQIFVSAVAPGCANRFPRIFFVKPWIKYVLSNLFGVAWNVNCRLSQFSLVWPFFSGLKSYHRNSKW